MEYAVIACGAIVGWILNDLVFCAVKVRSPTSFNVGLAFVGAVVAKLIYGG